MHTRHKTVSTRPGIRKAGLAAVSALAATALIATACSSSNDTASHGDHSMMTSTSATSSSVTQAHNQADVMFNQMMIPHHEQAVEMADLVPSRTDNAELIALATQIRNAQQPEIDQMTTRLRGWGVEVADSSDDDSDGQMDHGSMGHGSSSMMGGMMSDAEMDALEAARGEQFDTLWLKGMIAHHEGAVTMADEELANGVDPQSRELATQIKTSQQAEIDQMKKMLGQ